MLMLVLVLVLMLMLMLMPMPMLMLVLVLVLPRNWGAAGIAPGERAPPKIQPPVRVSSAGCG